MKLPSAFYQEDDVVKVAVDLLGKILVTNFDDGITSGIIVETEAYSWRERGCHAYRGKMTKRNAAMFQHGGVSYVYLCYGMHELFNVVTSKEGIGEAVLVRALQPEDGQQIMLARCGASKLKRITAGPGKLTKALGITRQQNLTDLSGDEIWIEDRSLVVRPSQVLASPRIGLNFGGPDALLPWRFTIKGNEWVSK